MAGIRGKSFEMSSPVTPEIRAEAFKDSPSVFVPLTSDLNVEIGSFET